MHPKSEKKKMVINTGLLAYTFIKLGDNLTNNDRNIAYVIDISNSTYNPFGKLAERAK